MAPLTSSGSLVTSSLWAFSVSKALTQCLLDHGSSIFPTNVLVCWPDVPAALFGAWGIGLGRRGRIEGVKVLWEAHWDDMALRSMYTKIRLDNAVSDERLYQMQSKCLEWIAESGSCDTAIGWLCTVSISLPSSVLVKIDLNTRFQIFRIRALHVGGLYKRWPICKDIFLWQKLEEKSFDQRHWKALASFCQSYVGPRQAVVLYRETPLN